MDSLEFFILNFYDTGIVNYKKPVSSYAIYNMIVAETGCHICRNL